MILEAVGVHALAWCGATVENTLKREFQLSVSLKRIANLNFVIKFKNISETFGLIQSLNGSLQAVDSDFCAVHQSS